MLSIPCGPAVNESEGRVIGVYVGKVIHERKGEPISDCAGLLRELASDDIYALAG